MSIVDYWNMKEIDLSEYVKTKLPLLRAVWPKLMAEELCSVQPMQLSPKINWNASRRLKGNICGKVKWQEYSEEKWIKDEDFFV